VREKRWEKGRGSRELAGRGGTSKRVRGREGDRDLLSRPTIILRPNARNKKWETRRKSEKRQSASKKKGKGGDEDQKKRNEPTAGKTKRKKQDVSKQGSRGLEGRTCWE